LISVIFYGTGKPGYGDTHSTCHNSTGYTIVTTAPGEIATTKSTIVIFNISATGANLFVQAISGARDNDFFIIQPTTERINESSIYDLDPTSNSIIVTFNVTTPINDGYYSIFIIAGNDAHDTNINFAYREIFINVGDAAPPAPVINIFDHFQLYLGLPALILLTLGTILVLINENKFVKIHGIFAGSSWILTLVNFFTLFSKNPNLLFAFPFGFHWTHMILGFVGLFTGFLSMLFGIAAERKTAKVTGYITLISWWGAFFLGLILVPIF
jgi:hypothetical protein